MRTTLTLDPDVASRLSAEMRRTGKSLKQTVNEALRVGLGLAGKRTRGPRFEVVARPLGLRPGIDPDRLNQLVDDLEAEETGRRLRR